MQVGTYTSCVLKRENLMQSVFHAFCSDIGK